MLFDTRIRWLYSGMLKSGILNNDGSKMPISWDCLLKLIGDYSGAAKPVST